MGKPAARVGDNLTPPHAPGSLAPGPGAVNVLIGNKPAWRANVDTAVCSTPIAPPAPAPHGSEMCYLGSLSVMIGNEMAVRQGDILIGAGPPDPVLTGCSTVLIGDVGFGLADRNNMKEFCEGFATLVADWSSLTPEERRSRLQEMANDQLAKSGLPPQDLVGKASLAPGNAQYSFRTDTLEISEGELNAATLTASAARTLANTLYHEARHAEQWYLIARRAAGQGQTAAQIQSNLGVTSKVASSAAENPLSGMSAQENLAKAANVSVYGSRRAYRNAVLGDVGRRYEEYRALPEEQDAWNTGDSLPCGSR